jgi:hypothetical protein
VTCYYFYLWDADFGPAFIKVCSYFPYPAKVWINGHEWAKRQAIQAGIGFTELSNGFATCEDPVAWQEICDRLGPGTITVFIERWLARLPLPLTTKDRDAGYWWETSMRQIEISRTLVFDAPRHARGFFEALVADNLDLGRPHNVEIIFNRRVRRDTWGTFRTAIDRRDNGGVIVNVFYKHSRNWVGCAARCLRAGHFPCSLPPNPVGIFRCARLSSDLCRECRSALPVMNEVVAGWTDHEGLASLSRHEFHPFGAGWS